MTETVVGLPTVTQTCASRKTLQNDERQRQRHVFIIPSSDSCQPKGRSNAMARAFRRLIWQFMETKLSSADGSLRFQFQIFPRRPEGSVTLRNHGELERQLLEQISSEDCKVWRKKLFHHLLVSIRDGKYLSMSSSRLVSLFHFNFEQRLQA